MHFSNFLCRMRVYSSSAARKLSSSMISVHYSKFALCFFCPSSFRVAVLYTHMALCRQNVFVSWYLYYEKIIMARGIFLVFRYKNSLSKFHPFIRTFLRDLKEKICISRLLCSFLDCQEETLIKLTVNIDIIVKHILYCIYVIVLC